MPRGDRTGPAGAGPMSGRAAGYCTGNNAPGFMSGAPGQGFGRGFGRGWGRGGGRGFGGGGGRGWRNWFNPGFSGWAGFGGWGGNAVPDPAAEKAALKSQAGLLQSELESIRKRLSEIEPEKT